MKIARCAVVLLIATATAAIAANPEWDQATRLYNFGDYKSALAAFRKIAEKTPSEPTVHYMLAQCYKNSGNTKQAILELEWISRSTNDKRVKGPAEALLAQLKPGGAAGATITGAVSPFQKSTAGNPASVAGAPAAQPPRDFIADSASQTISAAYKLGWEPCRASDCLNFGTPGWHKAEVEGHPPTDMWMSYTTASGGGQLWSQKHIGRQIKEGMDVAACAQCGGTGWIRKKY